MVPFLMDVHVPLAITVQLRMRRVSVLTSQDAGLDEVSDVELLDSATEMGRVLVTQDTDLLIEAASRQRRGGRFMGIIYAAQLNVTIGECVEDLELLAMATDSTDWVNRVEYLPLD